VKLTPCVLFTGATNNRGYGQVRRDGKTVLAHRVAYVEAKGLTLADIKGVVIRHRCDTPLCINAEHLETGSQKQNVHDTIERGRASPPPLKKGSEVGTSKLTEHAVIEIRRRLACGEFQRAIAKDFGITQSRVSQIALRKAWVHL
jgi:hypothetical protein